MITRKLNGNIIKLYAGVDDMPAFRYKEFCRFQMLEAGIGSSPESLSSHLSTMAGYIRNGHKDKALQELANYQQAISFISSRISPEQNSFMCMVHSINGDLFEDLSESGIAAAMELLSKKGLTIGKIKAWLGEFKKKIEAELETLFPEKTNNPRVKQQYGFLKQTILIQLDKIAGKDVKERSQRLDRQTYDYLRPTQFGGDKGFEKNFLISFETSRLAIARSFNIDVGQMTVMAFYTALSRLESTK